MYLKNIIIYIALIIQIICFKSNQNNEIKNKEKCLFLL
ncbi:hypothetical protein Niako_3320 [Niastella koreensis GR20-10]|uniref:Uncharacterized protein n=1 Tax=Niastella koreensis (strain DSM 17620 / KACC 11465 / NBRC 106392 / GR20-10) TaxID=700598 RepID=G8TI32_NIAKG|nr:hypothetical protein Niako_3320 [Niastella koreensis GR20-10]